MRARRRTRSTRRRTESTGSLEPREAKRDTCALRSRPIKSAKILVNF